MPEGPTPRRVTPCELGSAARLLDRRKRPKDGTRTSSSSSVFAGLRSISARGTTVTAAETSRTGRGLRVAVTTISSPGAAGSSGLEARAASRSRAARPGPSDRVVPDIGPRSIGSAGTKSLSHFSRLFLQLPPQSQDDADRRARREKRLDRSSWDAPVRRERAESLIAGVEQVHGPQGRRPPAPPSLGPPSKEQIGRELPRPIRLVAPGGLPPGPPA